jgi:prepilin-type N-terminal cleavage/methylation domain-containing protein
MMDRRQRGFTLIELLIVVVIIGILAAIAIPKFGAVREKAFLAAMKTDLKNVASQQEIYYNDNFSYTNSLTALQFTESDAVTLSINEATNMGWAATAVHLGAPSWQCGVYHGTAAASGGSPATVVGVVACSN